MDVRYSELFAKIIIILYTAVIHHTHSAHVNFMPYYACRYI